MSRRVMGTLFVDYVRMLRSMKGFDWSKYLTPQDLVFLQGRVEAAAWYPMETFERMGLAILAEIATGDPQLAHEWGRAQTERLASANPDLLVAGDPGESLMRFRVLRNSFFDYSSIEITHVSAGEATVEISYGMSPAAEEAATLQTIGFFERLLELAGANSVRTEFSSRSWNGDPITTVQLQWEERGGS